MDTEELLELMKNRRTIREFKTDEVDPTALDRALQASTLSPSGADRLPFIVVKVKDQDMKACIREESEKVEENYHKIADPKLKQFFNSKNIDHNKEFLTKAPVLLVIAGDTTKPYWRESTWLSIAYLLLGLESEGLGTVTYTPSNTKFMNELLDIPDDFSTEVILPIGYPMEELAPKISRTRGRVFEEKYS